MIALIPIIFAVVGLLMWALVTQGILKEAGKIMFACSFLALMLTFARSSVDLLR